MRAVNALRTVSGRRSQWLGAVLLGAAPLCASCAAVPAATTAPDAPVAPAAAAMPACHAPRASAAHGATYLLDSQADIIALLPPPPAADSPAGRQDLQAVLQAQRDTRTHGGVAHAIADARPSCGQFADVLGPGLTGRSAAAALAFLDRAAHQGSSIIDPAKNYWKRARPFAVDARVERLADVAPDAAARCSEPGPPHALSEKQRNKQAARKAQKEQELAHSSYPSGHAAFAAVCAILLSDMVPEKRVQLFARAADFDHSRLVVGAHFPTDLDAGRVAGTIAAALMMQNAAFQRDYAAARVQLRAALGLPRR
jgi:acid phosphatase (class A)